MSEPIELTLDAIDNQLLDDTDGDLRRTVTSFGTRIITQHIPATHSAGVSMWVPVGSRDETPEVAGSTHFLEHLLFKGTDTRSAFDIAESFDRVGGETNAETAKEHTAYWARVVSTDLTMAVGTITDMLTNSLLDPAEFEMERGVILDELAMSKDSPTENVHEAFQQAIHGDTPLGRPVGGTPDIISALSRDKVLEHYHRHYAPNNLIVAVAGDIEHEAVVNMVTDALSASNWASQLKSSSRPRQRRSKLATSEGAQSAEMVRRRDVEQAHVVIGTKGFCALADELPTFNVLLNVLGGSMSSRLFQEVREKRGLAYTTYAFGSSYAETGSFGMYAGTSPAKVDEVEKLMRAQLELLASEGPTALEMERVRGQVRGSVVLGQEDNWSRMMLIGRAEVSGRYKSIEQAIDAINQVSAEDVKTMATDLVSRDFSRALVLPNNA